MGNIFQLPIGSDHEGFPRCTLGAHDTVALFPRLDYPDNSPAVDEHLLWIMPPPVSGQQQDSLMENQIKEQVMREEDHQFVNNQHSAYQELNTHSLPKSSGESSNRPNKCLPTMPNLSHSMTVNEMLIDHGPIRANSEIKAPNQFAMSTIATQLPATQQPVCNSNLGAGEVRSQQNPADSLHQPQQTSPSEPRAHVGTDTPTSSGSSDFTFVQLWETVMFLFAAINTKSLQLFYRGCEGSIHKAKKDEAAASFCGDLYINFKKERRLVIEDDSKYTLLLNYIPLIKEWLQKASNPNRARSNKIPMYTELYNKVEEEGPLPLIRAGQLPEPYAQMIMERGKAYDESLRSKKRTGEKNEQFKQQDRRFKALGVEVDTEFELLRKEFRSVSKREALKERPDAGLKEIGKIVKHIQENWHGVQPVVKEPTHSGRPPNKAFKERQTVCAKATENEPIVMKLLKLIQLLRRLCKVYRQGDLEDSSVPTCEPTTSSKLDEAYKRCLDLTEPDRVILIKRLQGMSTTGVSVPDTVQASALPRDCPQEIPQSVFEAIHFDQSNIPVPTYFHQQAENSFSLGKTSNVPHNRKRNSDHEMNNREGEEKRLKVNNPAARHQPPSAEVRLQPQQLKKTRADVLQRRQASSLVFRTNSVPQLTAFDDSQDDWVPTVPMGGQNGKESTDQFYTASNTETTDPDQPSYSLTQPAQSTAPEQPPSEVHDVTLDSYVNFGLPIGTDGHIDFLEPK